jgi:ABC-2 type transport system ATP-binding protein
VPVVLAALDRAGSPAVSVTVARPSLDEVYLRHTGRRYSEAAATEHDSEQERELEMAEAK